MAARAAVLRAQVDDFTQKVRNLISDSKLRKEMGEAGRDETLKWNWQAATSVLRNLQYTRAERRFAERKERSERRFGWLRNPFRRPNMTPPTLATNATGY